MGVELQLRGEPHYLIVREVQVSQSDQIVEVGGEAPQSVAGQVELLQLRVGDPE